MDWPDDTLELMRRHAGPWQPLKRQTHEVDVHVPVRYPVTVPVAGPDVELCCHECGTWNLVAEWEAGLIDMRRVCCPTCLAEPPPGHEHGDYERLASSLLTIVLPVPERHYPVAFDPDHRRQAVNAIAACRMARGVARRYGLELVG